MTSDDTRLAAIRQRWQQEVKEHGIWTSGHAIAAEMLTQLDAQAQTLATLRAWVKTRRQEYTDRREREHMNADGAITGTGMLFELVNEVDALLADPPTTPAR